MYWIWKVSCLMKLGKGQKQNDISHMWNISKHRKGIKYTRAAEIENWSSVLSLSQWGLGIIGWG